jgi:hypothetical protein
MEGTVIKGAEDERNKGKEERRNKDRTELKTVAVLRKQIHLYGNRLQLEQRRD